MYISIFTPFINHIPVYRYLLCIHQPYPHHKPYIHVYICLLCTYQPAPPLLTIHLYYIIFPTTHKRWLTSQLSHLTLMEVSLTKRKKKINKNNHKLYTIITIILHCIIVKTYECIRSNK